MNITPKKDQIEYSSVKVENNATFKWLEMFFELRRDDDSPFTCEEIINTYRRCRSKRSFVARPGDSVVLITAMPESQKLCEQLFLRKASGLYGLVKLVTGLLLFSEALEGDYDREYYVISPQRDAKLCRQLALERVALTVVGCVARSGYFIAENGVATEEITFQTETLEAEVMDDGSFEDGYLQGISYAFGGPKPDSDGNVGKALGIFAAMYNTGFCGEYSLTTLPKGNFIYVFVISSANKLPDRRVVRACSGVFNAYNKRQISGTMLMNDGNLANAVSTLTGACVPEGSLPTLEAGVWHVVVSAYRPIRGGRLVARA